MSEVSTFMELAVKGRVLPDEIDDFVEAWHESDGPGEIFDFLGMSFDEYSLWVMDPTLIGLVIASRVKRISLVEAVNDNVRDAGRLAARAGEARDIARLKEWIASQPDR